MILKIIRNDIKYQTQEYFTSVTVEAWTNSCELSDISVKPTSSLVKIRHCKSS
jgi:hypothetical protein